MKKQDYNQLIQNIAKLSLQLTEQSKMFAFETF